MLSYYPEQALDSLEFSKVRQLLLMKCRTEHAKGLVQNLRFHTRIQHLETALLQAQEYKTSLGSGQPLPNDYVTNLEKELTYLGIEGALLKGEELVSVRNLALNTKGILHWLKNHFELYPELVKVAYGTIYEKEIVSIISKVVDDNGQVKDNASPELMEIRGRLSQNRQLARKTFEGVLRRLAKQGYLADISESFLNNRRTVAVLAEYKRVVKGILHGESDSAKTVFIEPEETIEINNEIYSLERAEQKEIHRVLALTTKNLAQYQSSLQHYHSLCGTYDFIRAKALLALQLDAHMPRLSPHPVVSLSKAYHPLLKLRNEQWGKPTVPLSVHLDRKDRILMISGPNAGGKTVSMKTVGILQLMLQAGMLVPVDPQSEMGIFKQIMVHIGDTQSIENELSTYSAHLKDMKHFIEFANGKTLFFIDELGSGSDPNLGGAFAEAIVEELASKKALGIITTHYLNLKVMAGKVGGIVNGAMAFDEEKLEPLYQLSVGRPGSSYTFAIAQRIQLPEAIINRARQITDKGHFKLDKMLFKTEQQSIKLDDKEKKLEHLLQQNESLKSKYERLIDKEEHKRQMETLKLQNQIKKEELDYLKDTERKFKQIIQEWKKSENKTEVIKAAENVLFKRKQVEQNAAAAKKADKKFKVTGHLPQEGDLVRNINNHQIGRITSIEGKKAIVKIGNMPFTVSLDDWLAVEEKRGKPSSKE